MTKEKASKNTVNSLENVSVVMNMQADGATQILAQALLAQAEANQSIAEAMQQLAKTLKPIDVCAIRIANDGVTV